MVHDVDVDYRNQRTSTLDHASFPAARFAQQKVLHQEKRLAAATLRMDVAILSTHTRNATVSAGLSMTRLTASASNANAGGLSVSVRVSMS